MPNQPVSAPEKEPVPWYNSRDNDWIFYGLAGVLSAAVVLSPAGPWPILILVVIPHCWFWGMIIADWIWLRLYDWKWHASQQRTLPPPYEWYYDWSVSSDAAAYMTTILIGAVPTALLFGIGELLLHTGHLAPVVAWWAWLGSHFGR
jgi:hypothetical protein